MFYVCLQAWEGLFLLVLFFGDRTCLPYAIFWLPYHLIPACLPAPVLQAQVCRTVRAANNGGMPVRDGRHRWSPDYLLS
jgi:hypothetical protein